jgi:hypothetical protein
MVSRQVKLNGSVVDLLGGWTPPGTLLKRGNFQSYAASPYSAWTGMFGVYSHPALIADSSMLITLATFPAGTTLSWDVTQDPSWIGINGYLFVAYGNYDDSPGTITPRQIKNITSMSLDVNWTYSGDGSTGLLSECWMTSTAAPSGSLPDRLAEVAFFPKVSAANIDFLTPLPAVGSGSFVDSHGVTWNVRESPSDQPYYIAYRPGYVDHQGPLPFKEYFTFLTSAGKLTGNEYFNGVAFGPEPFNGSASVTITKFVPTYA